ncbi:MAG: hypothetical protein AAF657_37520 [Acidobacteriota bacterium]
MRLGKTLWVLGAALLLPAGAKAEPAPPAFEVRSYVDEGQLGWSYQKPDHVVSVEIEGCTIRWHLAEAQDGTWHLVVRSECDLPFDDQLPILRAILQEVSKVRPVAQFEHLSWPGFGSSTAWQVPIAVASTRSADYQEYRRNAPHTRISPNRIYVDLARQTEAYRGWQQLFADFGVEIELISVEKVFTRKAGDLPFHAVLAEKGVAADERVIYEAGLYDFEIRPLAAASGQ